MKRNAMWNRLKVKMSLSQGMTMVEVLMVIAIIAVLGGVSFVSVVNYQRGLAQVERDGIAKEIFVAAQNHLTAAQGQGYLSKTGYGTLGTYTENVTKDGEEVPVSDSDNKVYYYTVTNGKVFGGGEDAFNLMLPFGSIDETIRAGGSYLIRYQPETATVLDVFYCSTNGSPTKFNHTLSVGDEYITVMGLRNDKNGRKNYTAGNGNDSVLGYYGGAEADTLATLNLKAPTIEVENGDKLKVTVTDTNNGKEGALLQLIVEGVSSGAKKAYGLTGTGGRITANNGTSVTYEIILDDITTSGMHFCEIEADTGTFIPGEDIKVYAVAYSTSALANIAYSVEKTTNSLFDDGTTQETAQIGSIRHLENLDKTISNLDANDTSEIKADIHEAVQTRDLNWTDFSNSSTIIHRCNGGTNSAVTDAGNYYPIEPGYPLTYDGKSYSIKNISANDDNAGLFGATTNVSSISNLELIDFSIIGSATAGALAGSLTNCTVTNVLARNKDNTPVTTKKIEATGATDENNVTVGDAGGLIGKAGSGTIVQYSAAAVIVDGTVNAGGLIGNASGTINGCYSGGHTKDGSYEEWVKNTHPYDVTGGTTGGLVGTSSATISNSYSTCSVSGTTAGGFAGTASGSITNCYATGYIDPNAATKYAFVTGSLPTGFSGNYYYKAINEIPSTRLNHKEGETEPMPPYSGYVLTDNATTNATFLEKIKPIDLNVDTYNAFVGSYDDWNSARAFDPALVQYYSGKYTLKTVDELIGTDSPAEGSGYSNWNQLFIITHYGDWPSPEVFFINT